jgi:hypothetical protein
VLMPAVIATLKERQLTFEKKNEGSLVVKL